MTRLLSGRRVSSESATAARRDVHGPQLAWTQVEFLLFGAGLAGKALEF